MTEVKTYLDDKKLNYKKQGNQFVIDTCPFCGEGGNHFYIHQTKGLWDCKKCFQTGNLYTLKKQLGDVVPVKSFAEAVGIDEMSVYRQPEVSIVDTAQTHLLMSKGRSYDYFTKECGYSLETIKRYRLGCLSNAGYEWLTVPHFRGDGLINIKYRTLPPDKKFRREEGCESMLFNEDCLTKYKTVFLTEGEKDALTLINAGYENVVAATVGAGSFLPDWYDKLITMERIYICYDGDAAGQKGAQEVATRMGQDICYNIVLPGVNDVTDFWNLQKKHARKYFDKLVEDAKPFGRKIVKTMVDVFDELEKVLYDTGTLEAGVNFAWSNVDKLVGPLQPQSLVGLTAIAKTGKTSFALESLYHWSYAERIPCLMICLEMGVSQLALKIVTCHRDIESSKLDKTDFILSKSHLWDIPLYFASNLGDNQNTIFETIRYASKRFGIQVVVFDNLHFLCRDVKHITAEVGHVTRQFKMLAMELDIVVILVCQPRKIEEGRIPGSMDLRDSSSIATDVDLLLSLYRHPIRSSSKKVTEEDYDTVEEGLDPRTIVTLSPSRYREGGRTTLLFDGAKSKFYELI